MQKLLTFVLTLSIIAISASSVAAQTRPRRIGQSIPANPPSTSTPSTTTSTPSRPPVLGGATRGNTPGTTAPATTVANDGPQEVDAGDVIRVNTALVTLPVSVTDRDGRYIPNLQKEDFRLWEDGVEQNLAFFSAVDKPFSVVLMVDTSGSTRFRLDAIQDAAITFVNQLRHDDRVMVVSFDDDIRVLSDFTTDRLRLRDAIRRTRPGDGTKLYDAVDLVMNQRLNGVSGRKAIVLFTDGVDTTSRRSSYAKNVRDAEELDALIYPVQYDTYMDVGGGGGGGTGWPGGGGGGYPGSNRSVLGQILGGILRGGNVQIGRGPGGRGGVGNSRGDYETANRYLNDLASRTGARKYQGDTSQNLASAFAKIAEELRRQYSLGFYPKNTTQTGQRRQIRVRVNQANLAVRTRDSYVFNPSGTVAADTASQRAPVLQKKFAETGESANPTRLKRD